MQSAFGTNPPLHADAPSAGSQPLDAATRATIVALSRALELHDPALARCAALRAAVISNAASALDLAAADHAVALGGALLADVAALLTHARPPVDGAVAAAVLGASLIDRATGCRSLADAVRHQCERWDGRGVPRGLAGTAIPYCARLIAIAQELVGPIEADGTPHWLSRAGRARSFAGSSLDPDLVAVLTDSLTVDAVATFDPTLDAALARLDELARADADESPIEALTSIGAAIHAADRVDELVSLIAGHVRRALHAGTVGVMAFDPTEKGLRVVAQVGDLAAATAGPETIHRLTFFPPASVVRTGAVHAFSRSDLAPGTVEARYLDTVDAESEIGVPLDVDGRRWGVLWARTERGAHELGTRDLATMRLAAAQITSSVGQASRVADLEALALRDPLTGLGNRRVLETTLRRIFGRPSVARQDCAVIICDVDGLKVVNDTEGHAAGDAVLADAASALRHAVADVAGATVSRMGGDEFCIVLDGGGMLLGQPVASRAQQLFARSGPNRSMSCGVAVASVGINTPGELLRAADEAQYLEKRSRRGATDDEIFEPGGRGGRRARRDR